jgi:hypothetical protein
MSDPKKRLARMDELIDMISSNDTKGCPDPVGGGCVGRYCTRCAVRELRAHMADLHKTK